MHATYIYCGEDISWSLHRHQSASQLLGSATSNTQGDQKTYCLAHNWCSKREVVRKFTAVSV